MMTMMIVIFPRKGTRGTDFNVILFFVSERPFPQLEQDEIRVLVFRDCDRKGKTLLFDSKAVAKDPNQQVVCKK